MPPGPAAHADTVCVQTTVEHPEGQARAGYITPSMGAAGQEAGD